MSVISFTAVVFLVWSAVFKNHFNAVLESARMHLIAPVSKKNSNKNSPEKLGDFHLYCSCYDGTIFLEKNF